MIDTYFDRVDAATGYKSTPSRPVQEDPRYYNGQLYATMINRNVAEAKDRLERFIDSRVAHHRFEMWPEWKMARLRAKGFA